MALRLPIDQRGPLRRAVDAKNVGAFVYEIARRSSVNESGCWEWTGSIDKEGYAIASRMGTSSRRQVHRLHAEVRFPNLIDMPMHHACANRRCVNPEHIIPVTVAANTVEMLARQWYMGRIAALEDALSIVAPDHELLIGASA